MTGRPADDSRYGTVERCGDGVVLRYRRQLRHPVGTVWTALTEPSAGAWFGGRLEIDLRLGGEYVSHHATGDRVVDRIVRLDPPHLLEHTFWQHLNPDALVTYELAPAEPGCALALTHRLSLADLDAAAARYGWDDPLAQVPRTAAGWHRLLDLLEAVLDGGAGADAAETPDLVAHYAAALASAPPALTALRNLKVPVVDLPAALAWYARVLGFRTVKEFADGAGVVRGVHGELPGIGAVLALREDPEAARALGGFAIANFEVADRAQLETWVAHLDRIGVGHEPIVDTPSLSLLIFRNPDGQEIHLYTPSDLTAGQPRP